MLFPTQRIVQAWSRSGEHHHGGGEDQSHQSDLVAVLVEQGRRSFSQKRPGQNSVEIQRKRDAEFLQD